MIWTIYAAAALLVAAFSPANERRALLLCVAGLVGVWLAKGGLTTPAFWVFSALIWIVIGLVVATLSSGKTSQAALLLVVAGVLVAPGRFFGGDYVFGSVWLFLSDVAGIAALAFLSGPGISNMVRRIRRLGGGSGPRRSGRLADSHNVGATQTISTGGRYGS